MKRILILLLSLLPFTASAYTELVPRFMEEAILVQMDSFESFTKTKDINTPTEKRCVMQLYIKALKVTNKILSINRTDGRSILKEELVGETIEDSAVLLAILGKDEITQHYYEAFHCVYIESPVFGKRVPPLSRISVFDE